MDWRDRCWSSDLMIATSKSMDSALPLMSTKLTRTSLNYSKESSVKPDNDKDTFFIWYRPATFNACRMKTRPDGFWRPTNQIFDFKPFIFPLKNNKFWCVWRLERTSTCLITVFYHLANGRSDHFLYFVTDFCFITFTMQIML